MADQYDIMNSYRAGKITKEQARELLDAIDPQAPTLPGEASKTVSQVRVDQEALAARERQREEAQSGLGFAGQRAAQAFKRATGPRLGIDPENIAGVSRFFGGENPLLKRTGVPQVLTSATDLAAILGESLMGASSAATALGSEAVRQSGLGEVLAGKKLSPERSEAELGVLQESLGVASAPLIARARSVPAGPVNQQVKRVTTQARKAVSEPAKNIGARLDKVATQVAIGGADPKAVAREMVDNVLKKDRLTLESLAGRKPIEAAGPNTLQLAQAAGGKIGESRNIIKAYKDAIVAEQYPAVMRRMEDVLGRGSGFYDDVEDLKIARQRLSDPFYEAARKEVVSVTPELSDLFKRQGMKAALRKAKTTASNRGVDFPETLNAGDSITIDQVDRIKRGLDDIVESFRDKQTRVLPKNSEDVASLQALRSQFLGEIEGLSDNYKKARAAYSGPSQSLDALETGVDFFRRRPEKITATLKAMNESDKDFYRAGVLRGIIEEMNKAGDKKNVIQARLTSRKLREQLGAVFEGDTKKADQFVDALIDEREKFENAMFAASRTGSDTQQKLASSGFFDRMLGLMDLSQGGGVSVARRAIGKVAGAKAEEAQQQVYDEIARLLTSEMVPQR